MGENMIILKIKKYYCELTAVERKVADYVIANSDDVINITVHDLAKKCSVAPSAVIRFCKAIKLNGFSELKINLAKESNFASNAKELPAFKQNDDLKNVVGKVFASSVQTLKDTANMLDYDVFEKMIEKIKEAKHLYVFGIGTSSIIATDAQYRFSQIGIPATSCSDVLFMSVIAANLKEGDVVLAISHSGRTKAVIEAVKNAKKAGVPVLSVTSFAESMLYKESDISLSVFADEENYPIEAVSARIAHITLIDAMEMALATRNFKDFTRRVKQRNDILENIRY